ncbi:MAG: universal stress protein [Planctomycetota bacterium]|jgi:nucleotide-binding universal stress UspA family protein
MPQFDRVLIPLDFSELSDTVLRYGVELTSAEGTTFLLHVLEPLPMHMESAFGAFVNTEGLARIRENAQDLLAKAQARYPDRNFKTELCDGKPDANILDAAQRHRAELIVMGTHGRGGIEDLFLGSTAGKVVRKARCPVLTVRTPDR